MSTLEAPVDAVSVHDQRATCIRITLLKRSCGAAVVLLVIILFGAIAFPSFLAGPNS